jgi:hypothetical protein
MKKTAVVVPDFIVDVLGHPKVKRAAWTAVISLTLDLLILVFFWYPAARVHGEVQREISRYRQAREEASRARATVEIYAGLEKRVSVLESKWQEPVSQSDLIGSLGRLASRDKLKVVSQDFDLAATPGAGKFFKQNLSLDGSYPSLRRFLADLEGLPTLTVVKQARLERTGEKDGRLRANLQLSTYSKPLSEPRS